jgi:hypothetical protein
LPSPVPSGARSGVLRVDQDGHITDVVLRTSRPLPGPIGRVLSCPLTSRRALVLAAVDRLGDEVVEDPGRHPLVPA